MSEVRRSPYFPLPCEGPLEVGVGHALISMVGPEPGYEHEYNRWYEDDHFFAGAMFAPWLFAGRRWSAPYDLQQMRYCRDPAIAGGSGWYLGTYWIAPGHLDDHRAWTVAINERLATEGRIYPHRVPGFTSFQDCAGVVYRDASVPDAVFSLIDPAPGIVLEVIDATSPERRDDLEGWLLTEHLPRCVVPGGPVSSAMVFRTDGGAHSALKPKIRAALDELSKGGRRLTVLWFLAQDPRTCWDECFPAEPDRVAASGRGEVSLLAPFIPSRMGTNAYVDEMTPPAL